MAPHAKLNDGLLDLVVVDGNISKFRLLSVMPQLFTGSHIKEKEVEYLQVKSFSIFSTEDEILNIDGELTGTTPIKVSVKEKEIEIFIWNLKLSEESKWIINQI